MEDIINLLNVYQDIGISQLLRSQVLQLLVLSIHELNQLSLHMDEACHVTSIRMGTLHLPPWSSQE